MPQPDVRQSPPVLTPLQAAWLQELGLGRRFLASYLPAGDAAAGGQGAATAADATATGAGSASAVASDAAVVSSAAPGVGEPASAPRDSMFRAGELAATLLGKQAPGTPATSVSSGRSQPSVPQPAAESVASAPSKPSASAPSVPAPASSDAGQTPAPSSSPLDSLRLRVESCTACGLHGERHLPVVGSGAVENVALMVIGEAPGAEDDRVGQPFRGKAGELLQAMLKAVGIPDETDVYFTHLLKCRPVGNRAPAAEEVSACMAHLRRQIALVRPRQLLVLGRVAAQALLGDVPVESLRGRLHTYEQEGVATPLVVTYHPAALLSRPRHKAAAWQDLSLLQLNQTNPAPDAG